MSSLLFLVACLKSLMSFQDQNQCNFLNFNQENSVELVRVRGNILSNIFRIITAKIICDVGMTSRCQILEKIFYLDIYTMTLSNHQIKIYPQLLNPN